MFDNLLKQRDNKVWYRLNSASRLALSRGPLASVFDNVTITEFPKSGGTWLAQLLAEATGRAFPRNRLPMLKSSIMHGHSLATSGVNKPVVFWRDGRDVMVSLYHHLVIGNRLSSPKNTLRMREILAAKDPENVTENLARFIELSFAGKLYPTFSWADFVDVWHDREGVVETSYEAFHADAVGALSAVIADLGEAIPGQSALQASVDKFAFAKQTGRKTGEEKSNDYLRKGVVGDWSNVFNAEAKEMFRQVAGPQLIALGYEADDSWSGTAA